MTFSYTSPGNSDGDAIRFMLGDTNAADPQLSDEEYAYLLTTHGTVREAAIRGALRIAAYYARQVSKTVGNLSKQASDLQKHYMDLADSLRDEISKNPGNVTVASVAAEVVSVSDHDPIFTRHIFERNVVRRTDIR